MTLNGGASWSSWYTQSTAALYHVMTDNAFPYRVCGGQQDSGSVVRLEPRQRRPRSRSASGIRSRWRSTATRRQIRWIRTSSTAARSRATTGARRRCRTSRRRRAWRPRHRRARRPVRRSARCGRSRSCSRSPIRTCCSSATTISGRRLMAACTGRASVPISRARRMTSRRASASTRRPRKGRWTRVRRA